MASFDYQLKKEIYKYYKDYYIKDLGLANIEGRIETRSKLARGKSFSKLVLESANVNNKKILDLGCGCGELLYQFKELTSTLYGIEPNKKAYNISCKLLPSANIYNIPGEKLPFKDNFFDIIFCYDVLEHVNNIDKVVDEMKRVLKKGGKIFISAPNYWRPYEHHYKILWIPYLPKFLAQIYLLIRRRPRKYINHINYTNPLLLNNIFLKNNLYITNISELLYNDKIKQAHGLKCLKKKIIYFFKLYSPLIYILEKS